MLKTAKLKPSRARRVDGRRSSRRSKNFEIASSKVGQTLIVVPSALLGHWRQELEKWCGGYSQGAYILGTTLGRVFVDDALRQDSKTSPWTRARRGQEGWDEWPDVIVCSDVRMSLEFGLETRTRLLQLQGTCYSSPLRQTSWLRVIVDEGQHRGSLHGTTNIGLMLDSLKAERRYLISGTPVTQRKTIPAAKDALKQLIKLFMAIGRETTCCNLVTTCDQCLIRHELSDIRLPAPHLLVTKLALAPAEQESLNAFVSFIKTNLLLTATEVEDTASMRDGYEVSLLNPKNRNSALEAIRNILLCCAGGGKMLTQIDNIAMTELKRLLCDVHRAPSTVIDRITHFVNVSTTDTAQTACDKCALALKYLLVTPCGHTVCPECVEIEQAKRCPACLKLFQAVSYLESDDNDAHPIEIISTNESTKSYTSTAGDISSLPSGFELRCCHVYGWGTRHDEHARRCEKKHTKWRTATQSGTESFVWLQPGIELKWHETQLEAEARLRMRQQDQNVQATTKLISDESLDQHSKSYHIVKRLEEAQQRRLDALSGDITITDKRPIRAIVFSEDRRTLEWIGHYLVLQFGEDAVFQHFGKFRADELDKYSRGIARGWYCPTCGFRNEDSTTFTCAQKFLVLLNDEQNGLTTTVREECVVGARIGRRYAIGERVVVTTNGNTFSANIQSIKRCGQRRSRSTSLQVRTLPNDNIRILLLSKDGRHGLSLPETTHIFLVSTIWEPSVEQQVIRRAARIGATHPVIVEQLLGKDTPEEILYALSHNQFKGNHDDQSRITTLLKGLKLLRNPASISSSSRKRSRRVSYQPLDDNDEDEEHHQLSFLSSSSDHPYIATPPSKMRRSFTVSTNTSSDYEES
eukprot:CAMPEP_0197315538 /NCGR_PEP_ID=MMETSP0891-20130614/38657_1 /TAXON_ID=44058 ORGANISM="Aureoumbra lagunensis, Strain CCMP1510" /NCGR_SAMPLE_ID=MMETSP0891 /ASSEMBLY_ACC=CAM_ASM_000534 /LENGTH=863 /DNA_ID=CAMNT_0042804535 /DNA_START=314 /DNA_END=2905 /DNA_ORIENTATION=+